MSQIAFQLDPVTVAKIKKSALLSLAGFTVAAVGILTSSPDVLAWLQAHPLVAAFVASFSPLIINAINEWRSGQKVL